MIYNRIYDYRQKDNKKGKLMKGHKEGFKEKKLCPLCYDSIKSRPEEKIIAEYDNFILVKNLFPYYHHEDHLLLIPYRHIGKISDLCKEELEEFQKIINDWFEKGYILMGRQFSPKLNNQASIYHFHVHFIKQLGADDKN